MIMRDRLRIVMYVGSILAMLMYSQFQEYRLWQENQRLREVVDARVDWINAITQYVGQLDDRERRSWDYFFAHNPTLSAPIEFTTLYVPMASPTIPISDSN